MKIVNRKLENVSIYNISALQHKTIHEVMMECVCGRAFVVNDENKILGVLSVDNFYNDMSIRDIASVPFIYDTKNIGNQVMGVLAYNIYYGILPVVDENLVIKKCVTLIDNTWEQDIIESLAKLTYL